jgi:3-deoxy-D-manno-octulosonic-acid transferase
MRFFYNISIFFYYLAIRIASLFNPKALLWLKGRKNVFDRIESAIRTSESKQLIWFHCASLGEFEQGRPLMEKLKKQNPSVKIILTFFSPSGYEIRKNYSGADHIFYLPMDTPSNAKKFIEIVKPEKVFFVKYEFWFNYLNELKRKNIPTYLVSGIFRDDHYFFKNTGVWFRKQLVAFSHFYVQDEKSLTLLNSVGYTNVTWAGDTRFDRVFEFASNVKQIDLVKQFAADKKVLIVGSSWKEDEEIISSFKLDHFKLILAPHEIDKAHLDSIIGRFSAVSVLLYSNATELNIKDAKVLVIDNIGMLSSLYQYGTIAFIGGGFGKGIHNILEAATFGLPVIFGPNYKKFTEAKELIKFGGAFSIKHVFEFEKTVQLLSDEQVLKTASMISKMYVKSRVGATDRILSEVLNP